MQSPSSSPEPHFSYGPEYPGAEFTTSTTEYVEEMISIQQHPSQHQMHPSLLYQGSFASTSSSSGPSSTFGAQPALSLPSSDSPPPQTGPKRYRSAPAKTFQCSGYGDCRMVFSRSEHLARHIRKHTGERPFACHCTKQFSRLDNLRQHAQTVHSAPEDKPLNERMMRALANVNASMMAGVRGRRRYDSSNSPPSNSAMTYGSLPSPPYTVPSSASSHSSGSVSPSFVAAAYGTSSPPFASPPLSDYSSHNGSPLPSPSFGSFPTSSSPYAYAPPAEDYLSHGRAVRVKQEEMETTLGASDLEGFYAAVEGRSHLSHSGPHHYASSGSLSSSYSSHSSSSSDDDARPDTATQANPHSRPTLLRALSAPTVPVSVMHARSVGSSPSGSPCLPGASFYHQQSQRREQLPSPPHSPAFYGYSQPGQGQQLYAWLEDGRVESVGAEEMSNAQYYAALQAGSHSQSHQQAHHSPPEQEYFAYRAPAQGAVYA